MSIKDRLAAKTAGLVVPNKEEGAQAGSQNRLRTGPGQMLMVNTLMKESNEKVALLEGRLKELEGSLPVRLLQPEKIIASKWANRISPSFESAEYRQLKEEIAQSQGNVQPIKVRPVQGAADQYEIVFGHRRHRACLELGLPVLALIEDVSDQDLFKEMDRENRTRLDLSPWEQGVMYRRALNEGLFGSLGELSQELGVDKGNLSKSLRLADLPETVVKAFPSPLDLQFRWAKLLNDALQSDPERVLEMAKELSENKNRSAKEVLECLLGTEARSLSELPVVVNGRTVAKVCVEGERVSVQFAHRVLGQEKIKHLHALLKDFLER
jgi:ParB family chromosome partitioning protein